jgi:hypothetical protein
MKVSIDAADKTVGMNLQELSDATTELLDRATQNGTVPTDARITVLINFRGGIKTLQGEV